MKLTKYEIAMKVECQQNTLGDKNYRFCFDGIDISVKEGPKEISKYPLNESHPIEFHEFAVFSDIGNVSDPLFSTAGPPAVTCLMLIAVHTVQTSSITEHLTCFETYYTRLQNILIWISCGIHNIAFTEFDHLNSQFE